jgi:Asp-tRNA(Asn)/Glu-tRNA(Gln) amidotransferase A subunit family amidase
VGKAWYNFFLVTDDQRRGAAAPPAAATGASGPAAADGSRRVSDVVDESAPDPSFTTAVTNLTALAEIYTSAQIAAPPHGYTVLKVAEMLQSEHIRALPPDVKRKSILVALDAAGVTVDEIVADAVHRDRALDTYERVLEKNLDNLRSEKQTENARLEQEIAERLAELRGRIEANNRELSSELENLRAWQSRKQDEERRISEAVGYFVSENPITTTTASSAVDKGDANARQT